jgi:hypothetical protein
LECTKLLLELVHQRILLSKARLSLGGNALKAFLLGETALKFVE